MPYSISLFPNGIVHWSLHSFILDEETVKEDSPFVYVSGTVSPKTIDVVMKPMKQYAHMSFRQKADHADANRQRQNTNLLARLGARILCGRQTPCILRASLIVGITEKNPRAVCTGRLQIITLIVDITIGDAIRFGNEIMK